MSEMIDIERIDAHYRCSAPLPFPRRHLDALLERALRSHVRRELSRLATGPEEEICIRALGVPVRICLADGDAAVARQWARAFAESVEHALAARSPDVVRYRSPAHYARDMGESVMRGDLNRAWAWRQLGDWSAPPDAGRDLALEEWISCWTARAELIVPLLADWARRGFFPALAECLRARHWTALAAAAVFAVNHRLDRGAPQRSRRPRSLPRASDDSARRDTGSVAAFRCDSSIVDSSQIARAAAALARLFSEAKTRQAIARLAWLEDDPVAAARASGAESLEARARRIFDPTQSVRGDRLSDPATAKEGDVGAGEPVETRRGGSPSGQLQSAGPDSVIARFGGLLFLLGVLEDLGIPERLCGQEGSMRRGLHALARVLLPVEGDAPEVRAFCGLAPQAEIPASWEMPLDADARVRVEVLAERVRSELDARLCGRLEPKQDALWFVCDRRAEIAAEPGWIELRFSLSQVSTAIRLVGLDLDPGYVPWLGVCVSFRYV